MRERERARESEREREGTNMPLLAHVPFVCVSVCEREFVCVCV